MSKKINPVSAVYKFMRTQGDCGINEANELCYQVCAAFQGTNIDANLVPEACKKQCEIMVDDLRQQKWGLSYCQHKGPYKPLIRDEPNFFPRLYEKNGNLDESLHECKKMCENTVYPEECKQKCSLHSYAIEEALPEKELYWGWNKLETKQKYLYGSLIFLFYILIIYVGYKIYKRK